MFNTPNLAGRLNKLVTIEEPVNTVDAAGQPTTKWRTWARAWAAVEPFQGREFHEAQRDNAENSTRIRLHYLRGIEPYMRVVYDDLTNYVKRSQEFNQWGLTSVTVTQNTDTDPDGTTTADTLTDATAAASGTVVASATHYPIANEAWTASVYIKKDATAQATRFPGLRIFFSGGTTTGIDVRLDTSTGETLAVVYSGGGTIVDSGAVNSGDYWRLWLTARNDDSGNTQARPWIYPAMGNTTLSNDVILATGSIVAWGAQFEKNDVLNTYIKTTKEYYPGKIYNIRSIITPQAGNSEMQLICTDGVNLG